MDWVRLLRLPADGLATGFHHGLCGAPRSLCTAALGCLLFHGSGAFVPQAILSFVWGLIVSGVIYVNLAGYHAKALRSSLASRASGIFVTSLYGTAAVAGYLVGWIATHAGWTTAGEIQISLLSLLAGSLAPALRPDHMSL